MVIRREYPYLVPSLLPLYYVICEYAEEDRIDCIVMGRRGVSNVIRLIYGSVSSYVLKHSPCVYDMPF